MNRTCCNNVIGMSPIKRTEAPPPSADRARLTAIEDGGAQLAAIAKAADREESIDPVLIALLSS
jgi:hypothetical protein